MEINKLKIISLSICCLVAALFSAAQCMEQVNDELIKNHQATLVPAGSIMAFAGKVPPNGWLLCDGKNYSSKDHPELYQVIKTDFVLTDDQKAKVKTIDEYNLGRGKVLENKKEFCVPDLRGRVIVGVDSGTGRVTSNNILGASGGEETHILTLSEMPKHHHSFSIQWTGGPYGVLVHTEGGNGGGGSEKLIDVSKAGGDQPHNNMQPYQVLNYIINTGKRNNQYRQSTMAMNNSMKARGYNRVMDDWKDYPNQPTWIPVNFNSYSGNPMFSPIPSPGNFDHLKITQDGVYSLTARYAISGGTNTSTAFTSIVISNSDKDNYVVDLNNNPKIYDFTKRHNLAKGLHDEGIINYVTRLTTNDRITLAIRGAENAIYNPGCYWLEVEKIS